MSENVIKVEIPTDSDGYVLFQCSLCGEYFKLRPSDYEQEDVIDVWCPSCGLKASNYLTDEVIKLAYTKLQNVVMDSLHDDLKRMEHGNKYDNICFKAGKRPRHIKENSIMYSIDTLEEVFYPC